MDRAKSYSWVLTVVMGLAITTGVNQLSFLFVPQGSPSSAPIGPALVRLAIFLTLSIRWVLGVLWYLDKAYVSKVPPPELGTGYFADLFVLFTGFLFFVPLAATIASPLTPPSLLAQYLNSKLLGQQEISTFIWILVILHMYDPLWLVLRYVLRWIGVDGPPRRIHYFWAILNSITLVVCGFIFLLFAFLKKSQQTAEIGILVVILFSSTVALWCTIIETSATSKALNP